MPASAAAIGWPGCSGSWCGCCCSDPHRRLATPGAAGYYAVSGLGSAHLVMCIAMWRSGLLGIWSWLITPHSARGSMCIPWPRCLWPDRPTAALEATVGRPEYDLLWRCTRTGDWSVPADRASNESRWFIFRQAAGFSAAS